jgi:hypothetical protein
MSTCSAGVTVRFPDSVNIRFGSNVRAVYMVSEADTDWQLIVIVTEDSRASDYNSSASPILECR